MSVARGNILYGDARRPEGRAVRAVCSELQPVLLELFGGGESLAEQATVSQI